MASMDTQEKLLCWKHHLFSKPLGSSNAVHTDCVPVYCGLPGVLVTFSVCTYVSWPGINDVTPQTLCSTQDVAGT